MHRIIIYISFDSFSLSSAVTTPGACGATTAMSTQGETTLKMTIASNIDSETFYLSRARLNVINKLII